MIGHIHTEIGLDEYFAIFPYDGMSNHDFLASGILQSKFNFHGWLYFDNSQSRLNINGRSSMWFWLNCIICGLGQPACYNSLRSQNDMKGTAEILGDRAAQVKIKMHPGKWWSFRFPGSQAHFIPMKSHVFQRFHGQNRLIHFSIGPGSPKGTVLWWWPGRIGLNSWTCLKPSTNIIPTFGNLDLSDSY